MTAQGKLLLQDSFLVCETFTAVAQPGQTPKEKDKKKEEDSSATNNKFKERQIFVFEQVAIFSESLSSGNHKKSTYSSPVYIYKSHIQVIMFNTFYCFPSQASAGIENEIINSALFR